MADCYGCPYRWHDEDCEYCSAKNDEIIDSKSYSKETCGIYKSYRAGQGYSTSSSSGSSSGSSSSGSTSSSSDISTKGCGIGCAVVIAIIVIIALLTTGTIPFGSKKEATKVPAAQTAVVYNVDEAANMRDKPGGDNKLIVSIPKGETVEIVDKSGKWWLVRYGEHEGYCNSKYLDIQD